MAQAKTAEQRIPAAAPVAPSETLDAGRVTCRAIAAASAETDRLTLAYSFGHRLITAWWQALTGSDSKPQPLREPLQVIKLATLSPEAQVLADSVGAAAARLDAETAAYQIGLAYTGMLPAEHRSTHGIYYTPPALTARLITQATEAGTDWTTARVLDPACGGGAFLTPAAQRIIEALPGCSPHILIQNIATRLRGYEMDPFGAWLSQVSLDAALLPVSRMAKRRLPVLVTVCDSLRRSPPRERFDLVIGNPPYGRVTRPAADRARFKRSLFGHANLYGLFTDVALRHARPGGVIAYVTPTSFLAGEYFKNLRALLGRDAPPATIDFVSARKGVFDDVLQETLLATYRRGAAVAPVTVHEITPTNGARLTSRDHRHHYPASRPLPAVVAPAQSVANFPCRPPRLDDASARGLGLHGEHRPSRVESFQGSAYPHARPQPPSADMGRGHHVRRSLCVSGGQEEPRTLFRDSARR